MSNAFVAPASAAAPESLTKTVDFAKNVVTGWEGNLDFGASFASGNTEKETIHGGLDMNKDGEEGGWGHTLKASVDSAKESDVQSEEEYRVLGQSRYNVSETDFTFVELEYVNDRFSGYQYRVSEGVGYGRKFYNSETFKLVGEASVGARQEKDTDDKESNGFLGKLAGKMQWKINDNVSLHEDVSVAFSDTTITRSETSLRNALSENLYLKLGLTVENNSEVPEGTEKTDTTTTVGVGYRF